MRSFTIPDDATFVVQITGATKTYYWSYGKDLNVIGGDGNFEFDGSVIVATSGISSISASAEVEAGGCVQQSESITVVVAASAVDIQDMLYRRLSVGVPLSGTVRWLAYYNIVKISFDDTKATIEAEPDVEVLMNRQLPSKAVNATDFPDVRDESIGKPIPILYGDWISGYTDVWGNFRDLAPCILLHDDHNGLRAVISDRFDSASTCKLAYYSSDLKRYAIGYSTTTTDSIDDGPQGYNYIDSDDTLVFDIVQKPNAEHNTTDRYNNVAVDIENVWDFDVTTSATLDGSCTATYSDGYWYRACSAKLEARKETNEGFEVIYSHLFAKILIYGVEPSDNIQIYVELREIGGGPIATSSPYTSSGSYTVDVEIPLTNSIWSDPSKYFCCVYIISDAEDIGERGVYIYEMQIIYSYLFTSWDDVQQQKESGIFKMLTAVSPVSRYLPAPSTVTAYGYLTWYIGHGIYVRASQYASGCFVTTQNSVSDSLPAIGEPLVATTGRTYGWWIMDRIEGIESGDVIKSGIFAVEDLLRHDFDVLSIDTETFDAAYGERVDWNNALSVNSASSLYDVLTAFVFGSACVLSFDDNIMFSMHPIKYDSEPQVVIDEDDIVEISASTIEDKYVATEIEVKYCYNYAINDFDGSVKLNSDVFEYSGFYTGDIVDSRTGTPSTYKGLASAMRSRCGTDKVRTFEARSVREPAVALLLTKFLADLFMQERLRVDVTCAGFSLAHVGIGDIVQVDTEIISGIFIVRGFEIDIDGNTTRFELVTLNPQGF